YGHWKHFDYGLFVIESLQSGELMGEAGFADFHRGLGPDFDGYPEGGWRILPEYRGQGIATEAMRAAADWLDGQRGTPRSVCMINPVNTPSLVVAHKLGYVEYARRAYKDHEMILFERFAPPR